MVKVRQDAWSHEDDLLLAETVLRHIREGSTQLNAFEEVGDKLNRTSAACGFRWNAEVRSRYVSAVDLAKRQRKALKRSKAKQMSYPNVSDTKPAVTKLHAVQEQDEEMTLDKVLAFLTSLQQEYNSASKSKATIEQLQRENSEIQEEKLELEKKLKTTEKKLETITEDYQSFIQIMERARKMTILKEDKPHSSPVFRMDKNGNLEQIPNHSN